MAKAFTYSRLPEHQVAVYYDGSDKTGAIFQTTHRFFYRFQLKLPFQTSKLYLISNFPSLYFRETIRVEYRGIFRFFLVFDSSPFHVPDITIFLPKGKLSLKTSFTVYIYCTTCKLLINIHQFCQIDQEKEETAFQRSCRYMATQHHNRSAVRIDLNALDLQRREADNHNLTMSSL